MMRVDYPFTRTKDVIYFNLFYDFGAGMRSVKYDAINTLTNKAFSEKDTSDKKKYEFGDDEVNTGYDQTRWNKYYFTFRMGFRIGFWLF